MRFFPSSLRRGAAAGGGVVGCTAQTTPALRATPPYLRRGNAAGLRRERSFSFLPYALGGELHRLDDLLVAGAAAEVSADRVADLAFRRIGIRIEQRLRGDQHSRSAVAALQAVRLAEAVLQHAHRAVGPRQAFDGGHAVPVRLHCIHKAGPDRLAVEHHRARAADAVLAADVSAGKAQLLPQPVDEREARRDTRLAALAVHFDRDGV